MRGAYRAVDVDGKVVMAEMAFGVPYGIRRRGRPLEMPCGCGCGCGKRTSGLSLLSRPRGLMTEVCGRLHRRRPRGPRYVFRTSCVAVSKAVRAVRGGCRSPTRCERAGAGGRGWVVEGAPVARKIYKKSGFASMSTTLHIGSSSLL